MMSFLFTFVFEQKTTEEIVKAGHPLKPTAKIVDALFEPMIACTSMEKNELKWKDLKERRGLEGGLCEGELWEHTYEMIIKVKDTYNTL